MPLPDDKIIVFYDGACPSCVRDRKYYESLQRSDDAEVVWFDITAQEAVLQRLGIDPQLALTELHVRDKQGIVYRELDAYRILMARTTRLKLLGWLLGLPLIRPLASFFYHRMVTRRLKREGRLPGADN